MKSDTENEEDGTMSTESADVRPAESTDARPAGAQQPTHHHSQPSHHHGHALAGRDPHHIAEAEFKALARALRFAIEPDPRVDGIPSTKGAL